MSTFSRHLSEVNYCKNVQVVLVGLDLLVPLDYPGFLKDLGPLCLLLTQALLYLEDQVGQGSLH